MNVAMGMVLIYQNTEVTGSMWSSLPYLSISLSLDVLLTLMIVIRLILHTKNTHTATGGAGVGGVYRAVVTMLVESCALYAVSSLLVIGPWGAKNAAANIFFPILTQTQVRAVTKSRPSDRQSNARRRRIWQVIAPLLIVRRVANKSAFTSDSVASERISEFKARSQGRSTGRSDALPGGDSTSSVDECGTSSGEHRIEVETSVDIHQDTI